MPEEFDAIFSTNWESPEYESYWAEREMARFDRAVAPELGALEKLAVEGVARERELRHASWDMDPTTFVDESGANGAPA